jgi:iron complex transport system substrate-binding protein
MALLALGLLATSCGNDDDGGDATDQGAPETRVVDTVLGEVKIPADPQNVVVDWVTFDNLAVLEHDMDTIGDVFELSFFLENPEFSPERTELAEELGLTGAVGATYELNAEALAALDPDLIVVAEDQAPEADVLDTMAEIAPVVVYDLPDGSKSFAQWEDGLEGLAQVLGGDAPERAADAIAGFEAELERVRDDHADVVDDVTVSIGTVSPDYIGLSMEGRNIGTEVATALGLARPDAQLELEVDEFNTIELSPERLTVLDADLIFLEQRVDEVGALEANPLFQGLRAVQAGNVSFVPNYWEFGGAGAALLVLADIDEALTTFAGA